MCFLQVFDPGSKNILTDENEPSDESSDEEDETDNQNGRNVADVEEMDEESDSEIEEPDIEDSAIEKTRQAVRDALGIAGSVTDTVSSSIVPISDVDFSKFFDRF